ncbi:MAG: outer membrane beta-barrel protein [Xanthomonadales bacterium]|nr:outer membrane beta-barrel protein [Xanthomonadales bacterium]
MPLLLLLASPALPAADGGLYATALLGSAQQSDQNFEWTGTGPSQRRDARLERGLFSGAALGWAFENGWRIEGEFAYQSVDSELNGFIAPAPQGKGNYASTSLAINALYSADLFGTPRVRSYFGAGLVRLTEVDVDFETAAGERSFSGSGNGIQLLFGARYDLGERWYLDTGLRWLRASSLDLDAEGGAVGRIRSDYAPWALSVGIGWRF